MDSLRKSVCRGLLEQTLQPIFLRTISAKDHLTLTGTKSRRTVPKNGKCTNKWTYWSLTGHGAELARLKSFRAIGRLFFSGFPALYPCCCPGSHLFRFEEGTSYHPNTSPRFWTTAVCCHLVLQAVRQGSHPVLIYKGIFLLS